MNPTQNQNTIPNAGPNAQVGTGATAASPSQQLQQQLMNKQTMSGKTIAIGCSVFALFFALIVVVAGIVMLQNPSSVESLGITEDIIKNLVKGVILFIAIIIFFLGFGLAVWSGYRAFTKKEGNKVGYYAGLGGGIFLIIAAIAGGTAGILGVNAMDSSNISASNIINPYLLVKQTNDRRVKNGRVYLGEPGLKVIGPAQIAFQFNQDTFNRTIGNSLGGSLQSLVLDCGNGQTIDSSRIGFTNDTFFGNHCLYLTKGTYNQSLTYRYLDNATRQIKESTLTNLFTIEVHTHIDLSTKDGPYRLNDAKTEIIVGENPVQLLIDATRIATDLGLVNSVINWDLDEDGQDDKQRVNFGQYIYTPKLHTITYALPEFPGIIYQLPVRVLQSNVPSCTVTTQQLQGNQYRLGVQLVDGGIAIRSYRFEVVNIATDEIVDVVNATTASTQYTFAPGAQYQVRAFFITDDNKQGICETDDLAINNSAYAIKSSLAVKYPNDTTFVPLHASGSDNEVIVTTIPAQLQLKIDSIVPPIDRPTIQVTYDGVPINPTSQQTYLMRVENRNDHIVTVVVTDEQGKKSTQTYKVTSNVSPIVGVLQANPKVGFDPLVVTLDASISQLNDPSDEVVYFTWDLGDGTVIPNVSQGSYKHTYRFSEENESGAYRPKVTVTTQKGHTDTIELGEDIIVKRAIRDVRLSSTSHPAQLARIGDTVKFVAQADGSIGSVSWDFGNGEKLEESGRQGLEATMTYLQQGLYDIIAIVSFDDHPPVTQNMKIRVE